MKALVAYAALAFGLLACLLLLIGGPGYRLDLWGLGFGLLGVMRYALFLGSAAVVVALIALVVPRLRRDRVGALAAALALGVIAVAVPLGVRSMAADVPPIHDITTDTGNPPQFVAIVERRADAPNPPEYAGEDTARQQRQAYPDLETLRIDAPPEQVFDRALAAAREMGWEIVAAAAADGRIEATATTPWYGFNDDVVIRIRAEGEGSRLDIRSKSRVGRSDLGANARRIRAFLGTLALPEN